MKFYITIVLCFYNLRLPVYNKIIVWSTAFNVDKIIDTFQKQLKQKQSPEFIKTLFELAVKNITVYPDKIKVALLVTQERFELPTP